MAVQTYTVVVCFAGLTVTSAYRSRVALTDSHLDAAGANTERVNDTKPWLFGGGEDLPHIPLKCPAKCAYCCAESGLTVQNLGNIFSSTGSFKCIMDHMHFGSFKQGDRISSTHTCETPTPRESDPRTGKSTCTYTQEEAQHRASESVQECKYSQSEMTYTEFLGKKCALHSATAWMGKADWAMGTAIENMYFKIRSTLGGICKMQTDKFTENHLFQPECNHSNPKIGLSKSKMEECEATAAEDMCKFLEAEMTVKRLDKFGVAAWAAATGKMTPYMVKVFTKPTKEPRLLGKFKIPGWEDKLVSTEVLEETDVPIDLAGGGFQCMMSLMQAFPMEDDLDEEGKNEYISSPYTLGLGAQTAMSPHDSLEVNAAYYGRYGLYQAPLHFVIPEGEHLLSDKTLSSLVFENIGAHRVEFLTRGEGASGVDDSVGLTPLRLEGPRGERDVLGLTVPDSIKSDATFVVRMEGLFSGIKTRGNLAPWGGNAFFGRSGDLLAISYNGATKTPPTADAPKQDVREWEYYKFVFRSSLVSTITSFDHLVFTHILASETLSIAAQESLSVHHPLRLFLVPHVYGNLLINFKAANNLFPKGMLVHRASPWAEEGFINNGATGKLWKRTELLRYEPFETIYAHYEAKKNVAPEMPFFEDGIIFHRAIKTYVSDYVHLMYKSAGDDAACTAGLTKDAEVAAFLERFWAISNSGTPKFWPAEYRSAKDGCGAFINLLAELIFLITGWHRHVGTVPDFFSDTRFASTLWKSGEIGARPRQTMYMQLLAATTNAILPKLTMSVGHLHSTAGGKKVANDFATAMQHMTHTVDDRNSNRKFAGKLAFEQMNPKHIEFGVMV